MYTLLSLVYGVKYNPKTGQFEAPTNLQRPNNPNAEGSGTNSNRGASAGPAHTTPAASPQATPAQYVIGYQDNGSSTPYHAFITTYVGIGMWLMNGATIMQATGVANAPTVWSIAETGDFNGDGKSDILWSDTSGNVGVWLMNGTTISSNQGIANVPTVWSIQGAGAD